MLSQCHVLPSAVLATTEAQIDASLTGSLVSKTKNKRFSWQCSNRRCQAKQSPLINPMTHELFKGVFITVSFFLGAIFIPVIGVLVSILTPLPVIVYYYQYGRKVALQLIAITAIVATSIILVLKIPTHFLYLIQLLLLGFICGELLSNNFDVAKIITVSCIAALFLNAVTLYMFGKQENAGVVKTLEKAIKENFDQSVKQYEKKGLSEEQLQWLEESLNNIVPWLAKLFPAIVAAATAIIIWINLILAKHFLMLRLHQIPPPLQNLIFWKSPDYLVWVMIMAGFGAILPTGAFKIVSYNLLLIMGTVYFFQGLAIIAFYFETRKTPKSIRFLLYFFIFFQQILTIVVSILGLMDVWANFRKLPDKPHSDTPPPGRNP